MDPDLFSSLDNENFKEIEDIIDARKRLGQYNVYKPSNPFNIRCVYSSFQEQPEPELIRGRTVKFDEVSLISSSEKDPLGQGVSGIRHTDSEITIVKVKCTGAAFKRKLNNNNNEWGGMDDIAIPGDGTHLGESPSMVNLATLVTQNIQCEGDDEYLVPLSSWDPYIKTDEYLSDLRCYSETKINAKCSVVRSSYTDPNLLTSIRLENSNSNTQTEVEFEEEIPQTRRFNWAGRFSKFLRRHWRKTKSLGSPETAEENNQKEK